MSKLDTDEEFNDADSNRKPTKCAHLLHRFSEKPCNNHRSLREDSDDHKTTHADTDIFCKNSTYNSQKDKRERESTDPAGTNCTRELLVLRLATTRPTYTQSVGFEEESKDKT